MNIKTSALLIILILFLLPLLTLLIKSVRPSKLFKPSLKRDIVHLIPIELPPPTTIQELELAIRENGSPLDVPALPPAIIRYFTDTYAHILVGTASNAVGERLMFGTDRHRLSARLFEDERDFIDWKYDDNFTKGHRYTLVIPLLVDYCNTSQFQYRDRKTKHVHTVPIPLGQAVLYNGTLVRHRITPQSQGCRHLVLTIPLYTNPLKSSWGSLRERLTS